MLARMQVNFRTGVQLQFNYNLEMNLNPVFTPTDGTRAFIFIAHDIGP